MQDDFYKFNKHHNPSKQASFCFNYSHSAHRRRDLKIDLDVHALRMYKLHLFSERIFSFCVHAIWSVD